MSTAQKKEKKREQEEEELTLFAMKLAHLRDVKKKYDAAAEDKLDLEKKIYGYESSFLKHIKEYQETAVKSGIMREEEAVDDIGRILSNSSSSWVERLKKHPELASESIKIEEAERSKSNERSHRKAEKSRKRKR